MCEANAYIIRNGQEELVMESVDRVEPEGDNNWLLVSIFGDQKIVNGTIKQMRLVDHKILFETEGETMKDDHQHQHQHQHSHDHEHDHEHTHPHTHDQEKRDHGHEHDDTHGPHDHDHSGHENEPHDHSHT